jgi:phosphoribosylanthranilate isomerase
VSCDVVKIKICGLRDAAAARVAVEAGADALGFILAPSRRQIAPEVIRDIRISLASRDAPPPFVGVTVNATPEEIASAVTVGGVDMIQLSGDERPDVLDSIDVPVIKALRFHAGAPLDSARREIDAWLDRPRPATWLLVEGHAAGSYGGTGIIADWGLVASIAADYPIWLAGGLTPENVSHAIAQVRPQGVDVSSGVEIAGLKDAARIRTFALHAREARIPSS